MGTFHGAKAFLNNYIPKCEKGQASGSEILIINDIDNPTTMIQFGWKVDPDLYGDDRSHFFIYFTANRARCYDLRCPGFVQVDKSVTLGQVLPRSSVYEGQQVEIHLQVRQDMNTKDWWLTVFNNGADVNVGYWPAKLLSQLMSGAKTLQYGGVTRTANGLPYPPMGSGYFPDKSYTHACFIRHIHYTNGSDTWQVPALWRGSAHTSAENCFGAAVSNPNDLMGYTLLFGGPGGDSCGV